MSEFRDSAQDARMREIENESVSDFQRLTELIDVERKRNDLQFVRIKALTALCEKLIDRLAAGGKLDASEVANELAELREVSKPVKR